MPKPILALSKTLFIIAGFVISGCSPESSRNFSDAITTTIPPIGSTIPPTTTDGDLNPPPLGRISLFAQATSSTELDADTFVTNNQNDTLDTAQALSAYFPKTVGGYLHPVTDTVDIYHFQAPTDSHQSARTFSVAVRTSNPEVEISLTLQDYAGKNAIVFTRTGKEPSLKLPSWSNYYVHVEYIAPTDEDDTEAENLEPISYQLLVGDLTNEHVNDHFNHISDPSAPNVNAQYLFTASKVPEAWSYSTGKDTVVAIVGDPISTLDQFDITSQLLRSEQEDSSALQGYDFVNNDTQPLALEWVYNEDAEEYQWVRVTQDLDSTRQASIIAAQANNSRFLAGIAYDTKILPIAIHTLGDDDPASWTARLNNALRYAAGLENDSGQIPEQIADVILVQRVPGTDQRSEALQTTINEVVALGIIIVSSSEIDIEPQEEKPAIPTTSTAFPDAYEGVVLAGSYHYNTLISPEALNTDEIPVLYESNHHQLASSTALPHLTAPFTLFSGDDDYDFNVPYLSEAYFNNKVRFISSPVVSSAAVAGTILLMKSIHPALDYATFIDLLEEAQLTTALPAVGDASAHIQGNGRLDALKAVQAALNQKNHVEETPRMHLSSTDLNYEWLRDRLQIDVTLSAPDVDGILGTIDFSDYSIVFMDDPSNTSDRPSKALPFDNWLESPTELTTTSNPARSITTYDFSLKPTAERSCATDESEPANNICSGRIKAQLLDSNYNIIQESLIYVAHQTVPNTVTSATNLGSLLLHVEYTPETSNESTIVTSRSISALFDNNGNANYPVELLDLPIGEYQIYLSTDIDGDGARCDTDAFEACSISPSIFINQDTHSVDYALPIQFLDTPSTPNASH